MARKGYVKMKVDGEVIDLADIGVSLTDGAVAALLTPAPNKAYVTNKSRLENGTRIIASDAKMDERTVNLPFHLLAKNRTQFFEQYDRFCDLLAKGTFTLWCKYAPEKCFKMVYQSCTQFKEFGMWDHDSGKYAAFVLRCVEPNPADREVDKADFPYFKIDIDDLDNDMNRLT